VIISGHQWSSVVISGHQWSSVVITWHQRSSAVIMSSVVISRHQWSSASPADAEARCAHASPWRPVAPAAWLAAALASASCRSYLPSTGNQEQHQRATSKRVALKGSMQPRVASRVALKGCHLGFHRLCLESSYRDSMADACWLASATNWDAKWSSDSIEFLGPLMLFRVAI
jgi:hypothetical protein